MGDVHSTTPPVDLVVPVKNLAAAKSRLRGAADHGLREPTAHARLALALAHDTVTAVRATRLVRQLLVISSDPVVAAELAAVGVEVLPDPPGANGYPRRPEDLPCASRCVRQAGASPSRGLT